MISLSFLTVLPVAVAAVLLGFAVLASNNKRYTNRLFAALSVVAGAYVVINYLADHDQVRALFWVRTTFALASLMMLGLTLFLNSFPKRILARSWDITALLASLATATIAYLPGFVPGVALAPSRTNVLHGPLYPVFLSFIVVFLVANIIITTRALHASKALDRERLKYVVYGSFLTAGLLSITNAILPLIQGHDSFAALGSYFILIFICFSAYAIVRHRLFNIRLLAARSATYSLTLLALAAIYGLGGLELTQAIQIINGGNSGLPQDILHLIMALVLAFTFQPLRRFFERVTNSIFFRYRYDSQTVLNNFSKILVSEPRLDRMLKRTLTDLCENLHIQFAQVIVFNNDRVYRIEHYGPLPKRLMVAPELAQLNRPMVVADELEGGDRKTLMEGHGIRVSMTLRTREDFVGYLLLGDKLSGDIYSNQDLQVLEIIGKELAVAIQNAKAYAVIQEFNLTLQAKIERSTNRLRVANRHLKELDHAKDEFISMASHQLRTPLTTIKGYLSMMQEGDAGPISDGQRQFVTYAFDASQRMVNLISDLLNVSRMSAGRFLIQTKPTDMVVMIEDEVRQLQSHAKNKALKLVFDHPANPLPLVDIDEGKTRQVIMNFIDNAIYYTKQGEVRVLLHQTGDHVRLEVRDTGIGVPPEARKHLFGKFFRADNAQSVRPDGTGLGLYLAKRVIEDQGGTIIFSSIEGKGSTFGFELPLKPPPAKHKEKSHARAKSQPKS